MQSPYPPGISRPRLQPRLCLTTSLFDNVHYGFPAKLHSDQGRNFVGNLIRELCHLTGTKKTRTTPYHPQGNGMCERFNSTLLNMLGTLDAEKKQDWKKYVSPLVHAYNATKHESTGFSPSYLMFGRHPRLPVDAVLGIADSENNRTKTEYVEKMKKRLHFAYDVASRQTENANRRHKDRYDTKVRESLLQPGDRVLIRMVGLVGKHKLADKWRREVYVVLRQPNPAIPVFVVQEEGGIGPKKTLHRNMLLSLDAIPPQDINPRIRNPPVFKEVSCTASQAVQGSSEDIRRGR